MSKVVFKIPFETIDILNYPVNPDAVRMVPYSLIERFGIIPVDIEDNAIIVVSGKPLSVFDAEDIETAAGKSIRICFGKLEDIELVLKGFENRLNNKYSYSDSDELTAVETVNKIINQAVLAGASDIHVEPSDNYLRIRFRIDGNLCDVQSIKGNIISSVITRIKIMAGLDIAERRLPQDGRIEISDKNRKFDIRVSTLPVSCGEKVVMRLLNRENMLLPKDKLGLSGISKINFDKILKSADGIILVTGPTGSGKTTTLYSVINELNSSDKNIVTVEDPVEYKLEGINQMQVNIKAGLQFSNGLRSILRQDPDIILVGEMRDEETADIAVRAAITGHLVFSTLHTNDAPSTIIRLLDMGVKPYLIAAALRGIVAQRLIRKICLRCRCEYEANSGETEMLGIDSSILLYKGKGCSQCRHTGYDGRIAVYEVMKVNNCIRNIIYSSGTYDQIKDAACSNGMKTLEENCRELVISGVTAFDEYIRVVNSAD